MLARSVTLLLLLAAVASARSLIEAEVFYEDADATPSVPSAPSAPQQGRGSQTWTAVKSWFSPVTNYFSDKLPDKTPAEFASDVHSAASDFAESVASHPVVEGVNTRVVKPAGEWMQDVLTQNTFRDIYDSAANAVKKADEHVADWIRPDEPESLH